MFVLKLNKQIGKICNKKKKKNVALSITGSVIIDVNFKKTSLSCTQSTKYLTALTNL